MEDAFHAYIIDWLLPDLSGLEMVRQVRAIVGDHAPIIILTAYDWTAIEDEARGRASTPGYYALVRMDVQMPVMNGYDAACAIRALDDPALRLIPIVAMTANAFDEDRRRAMASGMNGYAEKPINVDKLLQVLVAQMTEGMPVRRADAAGGGAGIQTPDAAGES